VIRGIAAAGAAAVVLTVGLIAAEQAGNNGPTSAASAETVPAKPKPAAVRWGIDKAPAKHRVHPKLPGWPAAGILIDLNTGQIMWSYRADARRPIASLTKLMNALVVTQRPILDKTIRISPSAAYMGGSVVGSLAVGSRIKVRELLKGMLIVSGNDAASALAQGVGHGHFVAAMNRKAKSMGLKCTRFETPTGLSEGDRSCARDLAFMGKAVVDNPDLRKIVRTSWTRMPTGNGRTAGLWNRNPLMRSHFPGITGVKTGHTTPAGYGLVATAKRGNRRLLAVMLAEDERGRQMAALLNQGFAALER
jgi:D-alanyl-D-alanine carboxypeptidase (penicillin-binding protein 5/6)